MDALVVAVGDRRNVEAIIVGVFDDRRIAIFSTDRDEGFGRRHVVDLAIRALVHIDQDRSVVCDGDEVDRPLHGAKVATPISRHVEPR